MKSKLNVFAVVLLFAAACKSGDTVAPVVPVNAVSITAPNAQLVVGQNTSAIAVPIAANGAALNGRSLTWKSSNNAIATVVWSSNGSIASITAVGPGSTTISATSEGVSGIITVTVAAPVTQALGTLTISPAVITLSGGGATQAVTVGVGAQPGDIVTYTAKSSNSGVATVVTSGDAITVRGTAGGLALITVTATVTRTGLSPITFTIAAVVSVGGPPIVEL